MNIIEPCCAERQIGLLLKENRGRAILFQTNGDMTLQKWMKATMLMAGDRPRTLTIAVPVFTEKMMNTVGKFLRLGWVERLRLMTTDPLTPEMAHLLAEKTECDAAVLATHTELAADASIPDSLLMFTGPDGTVIIQGPMPDTITPRLCLYAGIFGRTEGIAIRSVTDAWEARFRSRRYDWPAATKTAVPKASASNEEKKTRTRKTKKADEKPTEEMA